MVIVLVSGSAEAEPLALALPELTGVSMLYQSQTPSKSCPSSTSKANGSPTVVGSAPGLPNPKSLQTRKPSAS